MRLSLGTRASSKTPVINGETFFSLPAVSGGRVSVPSGPPLATLDRGQGRVTSQTSDLATVSQRNPVVMNFSQHSTDPWVSSTSYSH